MIVFVSPHAARAYRERVFGRLSAASAESEIREAVARPLFSIPSAGGTLRLLGCRNYTGHPFLAACDPTEHMEFLLVRTCGPWWWYHEAKRDWRFHGVPRRASRSG